jgi:hypothetical protein
MQLGMKKEVAKIGDQPRLVGITLIKVKRLKKLQNR